jgi:hypothetical protein
MAWWWLESPVEATTAQDSTSAGKPGQRTPLLPLIRKILGLVAQDKLLLAAATVFMVRVGVRCNHAL